MMNICHEVGFLGFTHLVFFSSKMVCVSIHILGWDHLSAQCTDLNPCSSQSCGVSVEPQENDN